MSHTPFSVYLRSDTLRLQQQVTFDITAGQIPYNASHTEAELKQGVLNGSITSAAWDTAYTSNAGKMGNPFIQTTQPSTKVF